MNTNLTKILVIGTRVSDKLIHNGVRQKTIFRFAKMNTNLSKFSVYVVEIPIAAEVLHTKF